MRTRTGNGTGIVIPRLDRHLLIQLHKVGWRLGLQVGGLRRGLERSLGGRNDKTGPPIDVGVGGVQIGGAGPRLFGGGHKLEVEGTGAGVVGEMMRGCSGGGGFSGHTFDGSHSGDGAQGIEVVQRPRFLVRR